MSTGIPADSGTSHSNAGAVTKPGNNRNNDTCLLPPIMQGIVSDPESVSLLAPRQLGRIEGVK